MIDVATETGLHRNTVAALYNERAERIDAVAIEKLCELFECKVGELFEYIPQNKGKEELEADS